MNLLLIDAYDSFVYIIAQYLKTLGHKVTVIRNDKLNLDAVAEYEALILGPGPGHPKDSGYVELINNYKGKLPIFGVCLGMQAIALTFGGNVIKASHLMHGKTSKIKHSNEGCFHELSNHLVVTRYHSLIAETESLPDTLDVTATAMDDNYIMGLKHKKFNIEGVQFHPESISTQGGLKIFENFLNKNKVE